MAADKTAPCDGSTEPTETRKSHFENVLTKITSAVKDSRASAKASVTVIIMRWSKSGLDTEKIEKDLLTAFTDVFGFSTATIDIPDHSPLPPFMVAANKLVGILNGLASGSLIIFTYLGHMGNGHDGSQHIYLYESQRPRTRSMGWSCFVDIFNHYPHIRVLVIMPSSCKSITTVSPSQAVYIAAIDRELSEACSGLVHVIRSFDARPPVDSVRLYQAWNSLISVHFLCDYELFYYEPVNTPITLRDVTRSALVSVSLLEEYSSIDLQAWKNSLAQDYPSDEIRIEAAFDSCVLITVPTDAWEMLQNDTTFNLVAHVRTGNFCPPTSIRPTIKGKEKKKKKGICCCYIDWEEI